MVTEGDSAPDFTAPLAHGNDEIDSFTLSDHLEEAPIVLAFFPGAFTSTCSHEMNTFEERLSDFESAGATIYGVSVDSPFSLNAFREQLGLEYGLISDANRELIDAYDVAMEWEEYGLSDFSKRAVFVVNSEGDVTYCWVHEDTKTEPDYDEILNAVSAVTA